jgi:hypothetical protein
VVAALTAGISPSLRRNKSSTLVSSDISIVVSTDVRAQWFNVAAIQYGLTIMLIKLSLLMLYRRVFIPPRRGAFDITLRVLECVLVMFYVSITIVKFAQCTPREKIWNRKLDGKCVNGSYLLNVSGMFNFLTDVLILLIPVKSVWKLQMKTKTKLQIVAIFTVGAVCVLRVPMKLLPLSFTLLTPSSAPVFSILGFLVRLRVTKNPDVTYTQPSVVLWGQVTSPPIHPIHYLLTHSLPPFLPHSIAHSTPYSLTYSNPSPHSTAELTTAILCLCFPPLQILLHRKHYRRGPTQSILNGEYSNPRSGASAISRRKSKHQDLLSTGDYSELDEHGRSDDNNNSNNTFAMTTPMKPQNVHVRIQAASNGSGVVSEEGKITKTVRIEQNYV